jgi:hypothetical protein
VPPQTVVPGGPRAGGGRPACRRRSESARGPEQPRRYTVVYRREEKPVIKRLDLRPPSFKLNLNLTRTWPARLGSTAVTVTVTYFNRGHNFKIPKPPAHSPVSFNDRHVTNFGLFRYVRGPFVISCVGWDCTNMLLVRE